MARSQKRADTAMNMFVCKPRELRKVEGRKVFDVRILERHPYTPQTFVPMGLGGDDKWTFYLVIVAPTLPSRTSSGLDRRHSHYSVETKKNLKERLFGSRQNPQTNGHSSTTAEMASSEDESAPKPKGTGPPDLDNIQAFIARGDQAVTYGPGTWHAPMVVLGERPIEFVVVQYANGVGDEDCQEYEIEADEIAIILDDDERNDDLAPRAKL